MLALIVALALTLSLALALSLAVALGLAFALVLALVLATALACCAEPPPVVVGGPDGGAVRLHREEEGPAWLHGHEGAWTAGFTKIKPLLGKSDEDERNETKL